MCILYPSFLYLIGWVKPPNQLPPTPQKPPSSLPPLLLERPHLSHAHEFHNPDPLFIPSAGKDGWPGPELQIRKPRVLSVGLRASTENTLGLSSFMRRAELLFASVRSPTQLVYTDKFVFFKSSVHKIHRIWVLGTAGSRCPNDVVRTHLLSISLSLGSYFLPTGWLRSQVGSSQWWLRWPWATPG